MQTGDEEVMAAYRRGDLEAFREIFGRYSPRLLAYFRVMTADSESARDMLQETWIKVHRARERYDPGRPFKPWIFRIASRVRTDLLRSWFWKLRRLSAGPAGREEDGGADALERLASPGAQDPGQLSETEELGRKVREELGKMEDPHRQAIVLHDLNDLTCREVAEAMGAPLPTVLSWLRRGRAELRERLGAAGGKEAWL